jgi:hypothetical protein
MDLPDNAGNQDGIRKLYDHAVEIYRRDKPDAGELAFNDLKKKVGNSIELNDTDQDRAVRFLEKRWAFFKSHNTA